MQGRKNDPGTKEADEQKERYKWTVTMEKEHKASMTLSVSI